MGTLSKAEVWETWIADTVYADISAVDTPDPVPMFADAASEPEMSSELDAYRLGRGSGDYLYLIYLLDTPIEDASDILPVYIGETNNVASRLLDHFRNVRDAIPISDWGDDGSWGSFGKYDHIATVFDRWESPLYVWVRDTAELEAGPYGHSTYRQELEAKAVGLAHSHPKFSRILANRDFVPNRIPHEMGNVGPAWVDRAETVPNAEAQLAAGHTGRDLNGKSKPDLWHNWVEQTIHREIHNPDTADPIPLFETDDDLVVELTEAGSSTVLTRSEAIDRRIRQEGQRCVHPDGVKDDGPNGLLYVMYQLESETPSPADVVPRYIGKAEAYGKQNELSANFTEIAKGRAGTRSFARWGDGSYWHVGELSDTVFGRDSKKHHWASELFYPGTHQLKEQTYLWIRAWEPEKYPGPYGYPAYLAEVEGLLIGLAQNAYPNQLLNQKDVPDDAPAKTQEFEFQPVSE